MAFLSRVAQQKKLNVLLMHAQPHERILEIGPGSGWLRDQLHQHGYFHYTSCDLHGQADFVGDIREWNRLGIPPASFDWILAFEVVEHVDCFDAMWSLVAPGGRIFLTSPVPHMDWFCRLLEYWGLNQQRTSPHDHLIYFENIPKFQPLWRRNIAGLAQWGIFQKPLGASHA